MHEYPICGIRRTDSSEFETYNQMPSLTILPSPRESTYTFLVAQLPYEVMVGWCSSMFADYRHYLYHACAPISYRISYEQMNLWQPSLPDLVPQEAGIDNKVGISSNYKEQSYWYH